MFGTCCLSIFQNFPKFSQWTIDDNSNIHHILHFFEFINLSTFVLFQKGFPLCLGQKSRCECCASSQVLRVFHSLEVGNMNLEIYRIQFFNRMWKGCEMVRYGKILWQYIIQHIYHIIYLSNIWKIRSQRIAMPEDVHAGWSWGTSQRRWMYSPATTWMNPFQSMVTKVDIDLKWISSWPLHGTLVPSWAANQGSSFRVADEVLRAGP